VINIIWIFLILIGVIVASFTGNMDEVSRAVFIASSDSIEILIKLIGPISLWLGLMNIAKKSGLTVLISRLIKPFFHFLFPDIPDKHPAAGAIILNISANILGLGNSATPIGIKAMQELQSLNKDKEKASAAMCTLLALNTSSITLIPTTIISLRVAAGSVNPAVIIISTIFATMVSTITALIFDKSFRMFFKE
jgi:spore maturation protein A